MRIALVLAAVSLGAVLTSGCEKKIEAPADRGVCYHAVPLKGGELKYNVVAKDVANIESCAAALEGMRMRFQRLGGKEEITGAYQGSFLFLQREGIFRSESLNGNRYVLLVRTGDGRLAIPGAMPVE
jgi:hypothetical protein